MDVFNTPADFMAMASMILLLLLTTNEVLDFSTTEETGEDSADEVALTVRGNMDCALQMEAFTRASLHHFRVCNIFSLLDDEIRYWVKPRSTTWFSRFLFEQYDDERWLRMFRMTKPAVFSLAELLKPAVFKKDTKYRLAIPVVVRVACTLFKLTHGASLLICSEMFALGRSTVSTVLRQVVQAINVALRSEISWPTGQKLIDTETDFKQLCGLPGVLGAIDGTHVSIGKPRHASADYFYFKSGGFTLNCQAVVDSKKRFLDLFLGMPGSTNDSRVLRRSSLYHRAMQGILWDSRVSFDGFGLYLVGDSGYPLHPWLMVPHRGHGNLPLAQALFNKKLRRGRGVVENAFGILKHSFRELLVKSDLDVSFLPDVITACAILHNLLLRQSHDDVERFLHILRTEGLHANGIEEDPPLPEVPDFQGDGQPMPLAMDKRRDLAVFLALQRNLGT